MLGQLQNKAASDALSTVLKDVCEHPMVRHEAAEALGSIAGNQYCKLWQNVIYQLQSMHRHSVVT